MTRKLVASLGPGTSKVWWAVYDALSDELSQDEAARLAWEITSNLRERDLLKAKAWKPEAA